MLSDFMVININICINENLRDILKIITNYLFPCSLSKRQVGFSTESSRYSHPSPQWSGPTLRRAGDEVLDAITNSVTLCIWITNPNELLRLLSIPQLLM